MNDSNFGPLDPLNELEVPLRTIVKRLRDLPVPPDLRQSAVR